MSKTIKGQKAKRFLELYDIALEKNQTNLWSIYERPSATKVKEFEKIVKFASDNGYRDVRVLGGNTFTFTAAYRNDAEVIVETASNTYKIVA